VAYHIAVCDDEERELQIVQELLEEYGREVQRKLDGAPEQATYRQCDFVVDTFTSAEELCFRICMGKYMPDLLLLDIYMNGKSGIDAAAELRREGFQEPIIFLTTSREYALEAFGVGAAMYLVKPLCKETFFAVLERQFGELEREKRKFLVLRIDGRYMRVAIDNIVYCEAQGNYQCLYMADGEKLLVRMTVAELFGLVDCQEGFVRVGSAYIVNLAYVGSLKAKELLFCTGTKLRLPRGVYPVLREQYFQYYCDGRNMG